MSRVSIVLQDDYPAWLITLLAEASRDDQLRRMLSKSNNLKSVVTDWMLDRYGIVMKYNVGVLGKEATLVNIDEKLLFELMMKS